MNICCFGRGARRQEQAELQEQNLLARLTDQPGQPVQPATAARGRQPCTVSSQPIEPQRSTEAPPAPRASVEPEVEKLCRICWGGPDGLSDPLIQPCKCKGSIELIHVSCLDAWTQSSGRVRCEICGATLMTRSQAVSRITARAVRSLTQAATFCSFVLLASNLPGLLGFFLYQLFLPFRLTPSMDLASYLFQTEPNIRVYIPCNVLGDGAVLLVDGVVRARRLHPHAPLVQFAKLAARGMVGRTVTRAIKEALGHSQTKGWCLTGTAFMSVLLPPLLAAALLPILGNWLASCVYVYGYWIEAALLGTAYWQWTGMQPR